MVPWGGKLHNYKWVKNKTDVWETVFTRLLFRGGKYYLCIQSAVPVLVVSPSVFVCGALLRSRRDMPPWSFRFVLDACIYWHTHCEWCEGSSARPSFGTVWCWFVAWWSCCCICCDGCWSWWGGSSLWGFFGRCWRIVRSENPPWAWCCAHKELSLLICRWRSGSDVVVFEFPFSLSLMLMLA